MTAQIIFLGFFLAGLVITVAFMLMGVERSAASASRHAIRTRHRRNWQAAVADSRREISARIAFPSVAAFATSSGAIGYLLVRYSPLPLLFSVTIALGTGMAAVAGMIMLVDRWVVPAAAREVVDERYLLQGHLARVTATIARDIAGEISYVADGRRHVIRAMGFDGAIARIGADVVIERIEENIAYVEPWSNVEKRL